VFGRLGSEGCVMTRTMGGLVVGLVVGMILAGAAGLPLRAQDEPKAESKRRAAQRTPVPAKKGAEPEPERSSSLPRPASNVSVQDALVRPFDLPFDKPTALAEVADYLQRALGAPVVLDLGALDRQELNPDDTVMLELKGVRLKTALKLLLDQVGLTYRVEPEDNLLVLTDAQESDERYVRILAELKSLHRDLHDLQDSVDDLIESADSEKMEGADVLQISRQARLVPRVQESPKTEN
jgi:hypothetical protein